MNKNQNKKVRITKTPKDGSSFVNPNEMSVQHLTNTPLSLMKEKSGVGISKEEIGSSYPIEKNGQENAEAQLGETIVKEDGKLFKINGKLHSKGGTPIIMEPNDFIFTDSHKIKGDIVKSEFGLNKDKDYTFADISKKYIKMNDYHKLADEIDPLDKNTAKKMISAYQEKLATLALLQEAQKGFPNGIPNIATPLIEKASSIPDSAVPKDSIMRNGGMLPQYDGGGDFNITPWSGDKTSNKKNASKYDSKSWTEFAKSVGFRPDSNSTTSTNQQFQEYLYNKPDDNFAYRKLIDAAHAKTNKELGPNNAGRYNDGSFGARYDVVRDAITKDWSNPSATSTKPASTEKAKFSEVQQGEMGKTTSASYKDMGFSSPEIMAMTLAARPIPYIAPTRVFNENYASAMGAMSNVMPYNYQSVINEATRGGYNAIKGNSNLVGNVGQSYANNAYIAGQLGEQTSKIKGDEYNQNANLYNQNNQYLAQTLIQEGQDKEMQSGVYNDKVVQGRENLWANKVARDKEFTTEYTGAMNNRSLRNAYGYLGASTNPNFPMLNANMAIGFNPSLNPFDFNAKESTTPYAKFKTETDKMSNDEIKNYIEWLKVKYGK